MKMPSQSDALNSAQTIRAETSEADRLLITPEGIPLVVQLAERGERLGATLLDVFFIVVANILIALLFSTAAMSIGGGSESALFLIFFMILRFLLGTFYFTFFELKWNGQTPGKRIYKIRVIDRRGGPLTPASVFARNLMREVELFLPLQLLFYRPVGQLEAVSGVGVALWMTAMLSVAFLNRDRMRGGDLLAGTWVIHTPKTELLSDMSIATIGDARVTSSHIFTPAQLSVYGVYELQTLESVLRDRRPEVIAEVAARVTVKIGLPAENQRDDMAFLQAYYRAARTHHEGRLLFGKRKKDKFDQG
jgi:uncharacterized RDD family membrane protein YckC